MLSISLLFFWKDGQNRHSVNNTPEAFGQCGKIILKPCLVQSSEIIDFVKDCLSIFGCPRQCEVTAEYGSHDYVLIPSSNHIGIFVGANNLQTLDERISEGNAGLSLTIHSSNEAGNVITTLQIDVLQNYTIHGEGLGCSYATDNAADMFRRFDDNIFQVNIADDCCFFSAYISDNRSGVLLSGVDDGDVFHADVGEGG